MSKKIILSLVLCFAVNASVFGRTYAADIVIEGNGSGSENQVNIDSANNTTVTQENNSQIENNVENNTNTGGNEANENTGGETSIQTGNAESSVVVNNENINTNQAASNPCDCSDDINIKVSGNGDGSTNTVQGDISHNVTSTQVNNATITNNITVKSNTGYNTANNNTGNVAITTGNITSSIVINNKNINNSYASFSLPLISANVLIAGNGTNSQNTVFLNIQKNLTTNNSNNANILNNVFSFLNTGHNSANGNTGNVSITTGNILSNIFINNENINSNFVHVDCECELPDNPKPTPTVTPPPPPGPGKCTDNCNPANGSVGGASSSSGGGGGEVLPVTGSYFLYLLTLASLITFFSGWYLRYRSGIAPGK